MRRRVVDKAEAARIAQENRSVVGSLFKVATALGFLGFVLLVSLICIRLTSGSWPPSISHSYHTAMGDILVGTLCAIGVFLISYKDFNPEEYCSEYSEKFWTHYWDRWWSRAAGFGAIGVALFPVDPTIVTDCTHIVSDSLMVPCSGGGMIWHGSVVLKYGDVTFSNLVHFGFAGIFFVSIFILCLFFFPTDTINAQYLGGNTKDGWEISFSVPKRRTMIFWGIGAVIALCVAGLGYMAAYDGSQNRLFLFLEGRNGFFWLESLAVLAFSCAWLLKAQDFR